MSSPGGLIGGVPVTGLTEADQGLKGELMAVSTVPQLCNDVGVEKIHIGVREFKCMGASPPHDHPHIFLDMGGDNQIICPYCSTLYVHDARLAADQTDPPNAVHHEQAQPV